MDVFENTYATSGKPLLVKNGAKDWKAMNSFSFEFFRDLQNHAHEYEDNFYVKECQFSDYHHPKIQRLQVITIIYQCVKKH